MKQSTTQRKAIIFRTHFPHNESNKPTFYPHLFPIKRVSRFISGSMSVEASIAVPIFLFFMINVLSMTLFFHTFITGLEELHQQGRQLSMLAYSMGDIVELEDEMIKLVRPVRVKAPIPMIGYSGTTIVSCCYMRAWTGYDVAHISETETGEVYVYMTENGSVYHCSESCTHLALSIEMVSKPTVENMRNEYGEKYDPCEKCGGDGTAMVYVSKEGDCYHNTIACSGLKRTVRRVLLSDVEGIPACSRCGG